MVSSMKFDFVIGNPPYQEESKVNGRQPPVYHIFMQEAFAISDCVELITPARFLFEAGQTPKEWNRQRLSDPHFKVLRYEPDASKVFPDTEIKGGVVVTIRNKNKKFGEIGIFTESNSLNCILQKVASKCRNNVSEICIGAVPYKYSGTFRKERPDLVELAGESFDLRTNAFDNLANKVFFQEKIPGILNSRTYGIYNKKRAALWIKSAYIIGPANFNKYKILLSKASGSGKFGEPLSQIIVAEPGEGHTQSFISIGAFDSKQEAENLGKYIKTKFCRAMLSVLRITQDITPYKWKYVPIQDFTDQSDINWNTSIANIDRQLYKKYELSDSDVEFIENNVKEMK